MIAYQTKITAVTPSDLTGFFVGWPKPPAPETLLRILMQSYRIVIAIDSESGRVVGIVNAISDGVLSAYIPLLEVLPDYQGQGIGQELVRRLLDQLSDFYMVDLTCDDDVKLFYEKLGMQRSTGMMLRRFAHQAGRVSTDTP